MPLLREACSYLKPVYRVSHTNQYIYCERLSHSTGPNVSKEFSVQEYLPLNKPCRRPTGMRQQESLYVGSPISPVSIIIAPPIEPHPHFVQLLCIFIALRRPTENWAPQSLRWGMVLPSLQQDTVLRDQNLWSCDNRKGYSSEDQHIFSIFSNETATYFAIIVPCTH